MHHSRHSTVSCAIKKLYSRKSIMCLDMDRFAQFIHQNGQSLRLMLGYVLFFSSVKASVRPGKVVGAVAAKHIRSDRTF